MNLYQVTKLKDDGSNWLVYKSRTVHVVRACNLYRHLLSTARRPYEYMLKDLNTLGSPLLLEDRATEATPAQIEENEKKLDAYEQKEAQVIQKIVSTVNREFAHSDLGHCMAFNSGRIWRFHPGLC
ncbi:hypothetical protein B0H14DRAFT_2391110 [Mycena olivaceomarginata]|nr:hypothetical protein B0H14DRAFT_2391110 [Mycena olivaceomarginata]